MPSHPTGHSSHRQWLLRAADREFADVVGGLRQSPCCRRAHSRCDALHRSMSNVPATKIPHLPVLSRYGSRGRVSGRRRPGRSNESELTDCNVVSRFLRAFCSLAFRELGEGRRDLVTGRRRCVYTPESFSSIASAIAASGLSAAPSAVRRVSSSAARLSRRSAARRSCVVVSVDSRSNPCRENAASA